MQAKVAPIAEVEEEQADPAELRDHEGDDEDLADLAAFGVLVGGAQPLPDHRHAHDDVAQDHDAVVEVVALDE